MPTQIWTQIFPSSLSSKSHVGCLPQGPQLSPMSFIYCCWPVLQGIQTQCTIQALQRNQDSGICFCRPSQEINSILFLLIRMDQRVCSWAILPVQCSIFCLQNTTSIDFTHSTCRGDMNHAFGNEYIHSQVWPGLVKNQV